MNDHEIDAGAELDAAPEGERGPAALGGGRRALPRGAKTFLLLLLLAAVAVAGLLTWKALQWKEAMREAREAPDDGTVRNTLPPLRLAAAPAPAVPPAPEAEPLPETTPAPVPDVTPTPASTPAAPPPPSPAELLRARRLGSPLGGRAGGVAVPGMGGDALNNPLGLPGGPQTPGSPLAAALTPTPLALATATRLPERDRLLTEGTWIDCVLNSQLVSDLPGMVTCTVPRDIYGASGRVVLIDAGSKVVGSNQGPGRIGSGSVFVAWSRIETPSGVLIRVDSPATGPLGQAGLAGRVDRHITERFGGAVLISLIGDLGQAAVANAGQSDGTSIQFGGTVGGARDAAAEALRQSIAIPPTITLDAGSRVGIFVARDLDFRGVYGLRAED